MEKIWLKNYEAGVPYTINVEQYATLIEMLEESVACSPNSKCYISEGTVMTYRELDTLSRAFAGFLQVECGLMKGERVAIMLPNILQYPVCLWGILRSGLIVVNVNPLYTARELKVVLKDSGAKAIVVLENFAHVLQDILHETAVKHVIVSEVGDLFEMGKRQIVNFLIKYIKKAVPKWHIAKAVRFNNTITSSHEKNHHSVILDPEDLAFIQYTGGTTADAKGVMLTHRNIISNLLQVTAWTNSFFLKNKLNTSVFNPLPLYHIYSLLASTGFLLRMGATCILIANPRDTKNLVKAIQKNKFSIFLGVNTLFNILLHDKEFRKIKFSTFPLTMGGGMAVQQIVADGWREITGSVIVEGYGLTEASPVVTCNPINIKSFTGSTGLPLPSTEIKICDDEGKEIPVGEIGELCVRGPQVMKGYWNKPEATDRVLDEAGWLRTGDLGLIDERGYVHLVDRKDDLINVSGFNVYPTEVEEIITRINGVFEVGVVGVASDAHGQIVKAYVVKKDPALTAEEIIRECHKSLTNYKVPREIEFKDVLPKTLVGKILRRTLREEAAKRERKK